MPGRVGRVLWHSAPLLLVLAAFVWCTNTVMVRGLGGAVMPMQLAFMRMALACLVVLACARRVIWHDRGMLLRHGGLMLLLGATGVGGFSLLTYIGLQTTTALHGLLLQSIIPIVILAVAALFYGEVPGLRQSVAILVSMTGVVVIVARGSLADLLRLQVARGDLWVLAAVVAYGFYTVLLRRQPALHPMSSLFGCFLGASVVLLGPAVWEVATAGWMHWTAQVGLATVYLAIGPGVLAYLGFVRGVELIGPSRAGQYVHLIPVFGSVLAVLLLGEAFRGYLAVGILLIGAGLLLAGKGKAPQLQVVPGASSA